MTSGSEFKAHGLEGSLVKPDWPPLTLNEVDHLLRLYPQAIGAIKLLSRSPRPFSAASVVQTATGRVFVKRHHESVRSKDGLMEEHRYLKHLSSGITSARDPYYGEYNLVQAPLRSADGETVIHHEQWTYEVHPVAHGVDVYEQALSWTPFASTAHARSAGRAMARLHKASKTYAAPSRRSGQLISSFSIFAGPIPADGTQQTKPFGISLSAPQPNPLRSMSTYLQQRPKLEAYADRHDWQRSFDGLFLPLYDKLEPWLQFLMPLWTHNDFHASNLTWSGDGEEADVLEIIDFGLCDRTNAVHDLATAIERNIVEWLRLGGGGTIGNNSEIVHFDHLHAVLLGYEEIAPLSYEQARALVAMLPLVHCEFALSETDYFLSILHSEERAYLAYEQYFLAHAEWFRSPEGKRLLDYLERWVDGRPRVRSGRNS